MHVDNNNEYTYKGALEELSFENIYNLQTITSRSANICARLRSLFYFKKKLCFFRLWFPVFDNLFHDMWYDCTCVARLMWEITTLSQICSFEFANDKTQIMWILWNKLMIECGKELLLLRLFSMHFEYKFWVKEIMTSNQARANLFWF